MTAKAIAMSDDADLNSIPTSDEVNRYGAAVREEIMKLPRAPAKTLWHYTGAEGMMGIMLSRSIWSTHVSCLNDTKEVNHMLDLYKEYLEENRNKSDDFAGREELLSSITKMYEGGLSSDCDWYVSSLSEEKDDLTQWRGYGGGEGGYAVAFDRQRLFEVARANGTLLVPVTYAEDTQRLICRNLASLTVQFFRSGLLERPSTTPIRWAKGFLPIWHNVILYIAPTLKHPAFKSEKEWRLIRELKPDDISNMRFRQKGSLFSRHLPLEIAKENEKGEMKIAIREIMVGPSRHISMSQATVAEFLRKLGYLPDEINVSRSKIPFQVPH
jgi:hypothetical protein